MRLLNFRGFAAAVVMLEAVVLAKIHTGSAYHEKTGEQKNNREFSVLGQLKSVLHAVATLADFQTCNGN